MALEETVSNDITCLYAAKNFLQYVALKQPEPVKGIVAIQAMQDILKARCKTAFNDLGKWIQENEDEDDGSEAAKFVKEALTKTYKQIKCEISDLYKKLKASNGLPKDDENEFKKFLKEFKKEDIEMMIYGSGQQEVFQEAIDSSPDADYMKELRRKIDRAYENYFASAGINTPEGHAAWDIAHSGGLYFDCVINSNPQKKVDENTIKVAQTDLESYIVGAVAEGVRSARSNALVENSEKLHADAVQWLSREINDRLSIAKDLYI